MRNLLHFLYARMKITRIFYSIWLTKKKIIFGLCAPHAFNNWGLTIFISTPWLNAIMYLPNLPTYQYLAYCVNKIVKKKQKKNQLTNLIEIIDRWFTIVKSVENCCMLFCWLLWYSCRVHWPQFPPGCDRVCLKFLIILHNVIYNYTTI